MKYRFLLLSSLLASATVMAQNPYKKVGIAPETNKQPEVGTAPVLVNEGLTGSLTEDEGPVLFNEDFATGDAQWANASLNASGAVWVYRGPSTTPNNTVGSQGAYVGTAGIIQSSTPGNGFMIFDSDWYDNGGVAGNFGGGSEPAPHAGALTSPIIDCSSESGVLLTFNSYFRHYDAHGYVIVTNDNFVTADTVWNGSDFHDVNTASPADEFVKVNITDVAAGSATVKVRFLFTGQGNATPTGYYFWMIDDISVVGAADFDLAVAESFFRGAGSLNANFKYTNYYNQLPLSQAEATNFKFGAAISNNSDATMTNVVLTADVSGAGTFSGTSTPATYTTFGIGDTVNVTTTFTPSSTGNYVLDLSVEADSADDYPGDNSLSKEFNVTDRTFCWNDAEVGGGSSWSNGSHSIFSRFEFIEDDYITAIDYAIWSSATFLSDDGAVVEVGIWALDWVIENGDTVNAQLGTALVPTTFKVMSSGDYTDGTNNNMIRIPFEEPVLVPAGEYLVGYKRSSGTIRTATSDLSPTPLAAWVDVQSDGSIDGWPDLNPIISLETWSPDICANSNIAINIDVICNPAEFTATLDGQAFNGVQPYTYEWNTGSEDASIDVDTEGTYILTVMDADFCSAVDTVEVINANFANCNLSVGNISGADFNFSVVPNPNNGLFNLVFDNVQTNDVNIEVQSLKGDIIYSSSMNIAEGAARSISMNGVASGLYILKVSSERGTSFEKIIVQ